MVKFSLVCLLRPELSTSLPPLVPKWPPPTSPCPAEPLRTGWLPPVWGLLSAAVTNSWVKSGHCSPTLAHCFPTHGQSAVYKRLVSCVQNRTWPKISSVNISFLHLFSSLPAGTGSLVTLYWVSLATGGGVCAPWNSLPRVPGVEITFWPQDTAARGVPISTPKRRWLSCPVSTRLTRNAGHPASSPQTTASSGPSHSISRLPGPRPSHASSLSHLHLCLIFVLYSLSWESFLPSAPLCSLKGPLHKTCLSPELFSLVFLRCKLEMPERELWVTWKEACLTPLLKWRDFPRMWGPGTEQLHTPDLLSPHPIPLSWVGGACTAPWRRMPASSAGHLGRLGWRDKR